MAWLNKRNSPTYHELEQGKQVEVEPDPKLLRGQGRAKLRDSLRHVVHRTPEADIVGVQDSDPLGVGDRGKLVDETCVLIRICCLYEMVTKWGLAGYTGGASSLWLER
jgi:hypothetical protein